LLKHKEGRVDFISGLGFSTGPGSRMKAGLDGCDPRKTRLLQPVSVQTGAAVD
jgi:hypothetical protein